MYSFLAVLVVIEHFKHSCESEVPFEKKNARYSCVFVVSKLIVSET